MTMNVATLALAITLCAPTTPAATARSYASIVLDSAAVKAGIDPLLIVALVDRESGWTPGARNPKSGALGLGQILPQYRPACLPGAGGTTGASCQAERKRLLDGVYNLTATVSIVEAWRATCKSKGKAGEAWLLTGYAGAGTKGAACGTVEKIPSVVKGYLARRRALRLRLEALSP